ncbi:DNA -binding domain-containing protein [Mesorhizobium sp. CO1-1-8]|uniref:DNA -binding domain-containing protein n=1 Tax=Mesorhizobium sp. CO1-1-8 TaxID=2876631 RepID=UPI0029621DCA|nr:DUF2285 domain-containing protein [Mesorhizobium sp. CO1-1-8]
MRSRHLISKSRPPCSAGGWSSAAEWHNSAFRYQTHRLMCDGLKMVERGYRQLLRARRMRCAAGLMR